MLKLYKTAIFVNLLFVTTLFAQGAKQEPIKIDTQIRNESGAKKSTVFSIEDDSSKFKVDPAEVNKIKAMDMQVVKEKIEMLRDNVLDAKSKLIEVSKNDLNSSIPVSYLTITHNNDMSARFDIISLKYILDGKNVYSYYRVDEDASKKVYSVFSSFVTPGHHEIIVEAIVSGSATGAFDYLKDYRIKVQDRFAFMAPDKKKIVVSGSSYEKGGIFTSFKNRPGVKFYTVVENRIAEKIEK